MGRANILVVEDDPDVAELVVYNLRAAGFEAQAVASGEGALDRVHARPPSLVVLDLMLPGMDGLEVCTQLKSKPATSPIPIIMLTARSEETDIVVGLEMGADDYLTKPFSPRVLVARVKALLRRRAEGPPATGDTICLGRLAIDPGRYEVRVDDQQVHLTTTEFNLLHTLANKPGWVFSRHQIVDAIRGEDYPVTERAVDVHVVALRKKLGEAAGQIETVRGVGYRLKA
jgi:two-component system phosphate regulon response regulator PhoB